jgi:uncharacterized protein (UPF0212 family)
MNAVQNDSGLTSRCADCGAEFSPAWRYLAARCALCGIREDLAVATTTARLIQQNEEMK